MMLVHSTDIDDRTVIQISGDINYTNLSDFRESLFRFLETAVSSVLLDMKDLRSINADGIQVVLDLYAQYTQSHEIMIVNTSTEVDKLLLLTGLDNLMTINNQLHYSGAH